jgi:protein-S-isoprenylcysteine O-methyltransferase Ste14
MDLNRNQFFFVGVIFLLMGIQFRMVTSFVLTTEATRFLAERTQTADRSMIDLATDVGAGPQKVVRPPEWLGWCLMSIGSVLILHSLAMKKPGT